MLDSFFGSLVLMNCIKYITSSSFLFHENVTFSRLQILNFAFLVAQYEKNMACIMKTRNLMA